MPPKHNSQAERYPQELRVLSNQQISVSTRLLRLDHSPRFDSGQVASLSAAALPQRLYSIASQPESQLEILYNRVEPGQLSPHLWQLEAGDRVNLHDIRGSFIDPALQKTQVNKSKIDEKIWWIANGSGVAPFISTIRHAMTTKASWLSQRTLVYGLRRMDEICFLQLLLEAQAEHGLEFVLCLSSPDAQSEVLANKNLSPTLATRLFYGRLTLWQGLKTISEQDRVMLCGSSAMIATVREQVLSHGLDVSRVMSENWF